ncbi:MAG: hypothetical protein ACK4K7_16135 [Allosphingosinicella sp.]|uniref:hypothetical protein n=1 Tax=Allosphingosinicella sp. TaxID=2823234 RepID=UPI003936DA46
MLRFLAMLLIGCALWAGAGAAARAGEAIVARATLPLSFEGGALGGPGAEALVAAAADAQFVILIESHNDAATPAITADLFRRLHAAHGFDHLALEQDPFGMEAASAPDRRGRLDAIAAYARAYPYSFTFATDEELALIAAAGRISTARSQPAWGVDQAFGAAAALEELLGLAGTAEARCLAAGLLADARADEGRRGADGRRDQAAHHFLSRAEGLEARLAALRAAMAPAEGSRAAELLEALQVSADIYSYYRRADEPGADGAPLGLLNNWVREDWMKRRFLHHYRAAERAGGRPPKVLVKAGYWHAVRGRGPGNVFTLGNFLHEFAIANGRTALSVQVLPLREWWPDHGAVDPEYRVLLAPDAMDRPSLVDLRPIRAHVHRGHRFGLDDAALRNFRDLVFGVDFALFVPSEPGGYSLTTR